MNRVHIAPGASAAGCLKQALRPNTEKILVSWDLFSCGPHPKVESLEDWLSIREAYVKQLIPEWPEFSFSEVQVQHELITNISDLVAADEIILWKSFGLQEQMLAAWLVWAMEVAGADSRNLYVVEFDKHKSSGNWIRVLGELHPDAIKNGPEPRQLDEHEINELRQVWAALTASTPEEYIQLVADDSEVSDPMKRSLSAIKARYPGSQTGLGVWDTSLLRYAREKGPKASRIIGYSIGFADEIDSVGDGYLLLRLRELSSRAKPLVKLTGDATKIRELSVELTTEGNAVLSGQVNNVELNGIDDWVCGVHLDSVTGRVWFNDNGTLVETS